MSARRALGLLTSGLIAGALVAQGTGCKPRPAPEEDDAPHRNKNYLADSGFRPPRNGYSFQNQGGQYPKTPPVLTSAGVAKMFGKGACLGGNTAKCKLTPAANEWMGTVNRLMNGGQCEGMAVSTLAFFKKVNDPGTYANGVTSVHELTHDQVGPLIGYYWAFQMVNPVRSAMMKSMLFQTPNQVEDTLVEMLKKGELATVAIRGPHGGHAVTPYAVEDRHDGTHWIRIYDNNWPDKDRYITIDRRANTWKYELASLNPAIPKEPWGGDASSHTIAVVPLSTRLGMAECPFCTGSGRKSVVPRGGNSVTITNQDGKRLGSDGDKVVNEIPDAEVVDLNSYVDGVAVSHPIYVVPADGDYDVHVSGTDQKGAESHDGDYGVAIIGNGEAVAVETPRLKPGERDTLSLNRDGGVRYATGSGGTIPPIRLAHDGDGTHGMTARITNMKADAHESVELRMDHKSGDVHVSGGGKRSESYDIHVRHVHADHEDTEVEHKGIKYKSSESHTVHTDPKPGAKQSGEPDVKRTPRSSPTAAPKHGGKR
jgi:hypothetical protein